MADNRFRGIGLGCSGQTSVEFLFIFLIMLFYVQVIIQPNLTKATDSITAINKLGQAKLSAKKLANAINEVTALSGESSKTIWLFLDDGTSVWCVEADKEIHYKADTSVDLSSEFPDNCTATECEGKTKVLDGTQLNCSNFPTQAGIPMPKARVRVWKEGGITYVQRFE